MTARGASQVHVHLLGTAGGAATYVRGDGQAPHGAASALEVDGRLYLVDAGQGVSRQLARIRARDHRDDGVGAFKRLEAVFLSHLHSDHTMDLANLVLCAPNHGWPSRRVPVYGPGPVGGDTPVPGTTDLLHALSVAFRGDFLNRGGRTGDANPFAELVVAQDILPPDGPAQAEPWLVAEDERVRVTAALVDHGQTYPSLAYRFDTARGAVVFSGDTAPSDSLVALARDAELLVHEVMHPSIVDWLAKADPGFTTELGAAVMSKHTDVADVGAIAERAGVRRLILSPIAPGHLPDHAWSVFGDSAQVVVGKDLMRLTL